MIILYIFIGWYLCGLLGMLISFIREVIQKKEITITVGTLLWVLFGSFLGPTILIFVISTFNIVDKQIVTLNKSNK